MPPFDAAALLAWCEQQQPAILDAIRQVVEEETPSDDKARNDAFVRRLSERYSAAGAHVQLLPSVPRGDHLIAHYAPAPVPSHEKPALILCHYDTVWKTGSLETHPYRIDEQGWAYGPGIFDMQSSLILVEYALRAIAHFGLTLPRPVAILVTSDEEVGSPTSREHIETYARQAEYVLVMESPLPGGVVKTARKGVGSYKVEITGKAAHAGVEPEKGISAIHEAAFQIMALQVLNNPSEGTTVSPGVIHGGTASNVIPASAVIDVDTRAWTQAEAERVDAAIKGLKAHVPGAVVKVTGGWNRPPLERSATAALFARAHEIGKAFGLDLQEGSTGGGSDGNFTGALGIPTLDGLGVPGHGAHADHEHIEVDQIANRVALLTAMLVQI